MALPKLTALLNIIAGLGTTPQERGLTTDAFKAKFDEAAGVIKDYLNDTLTVGLDAALDLKADELVSIAQVTASKTLALADASVLQVCTHAATQINLTVPPYSSVPFQVGTQIPIKRNGVAETAVIQGAGVTINPAKYKITSQYDYAVLVNEAVDVWGFLGSTKA